MSNKPDTRLPRFLIIGAMKAGTTSLYHYLNLHPEISMSRIKETDFFCEKNFKKGLEWYKKMFPANSRIKGEASTNYSKYPAETGVPERIYQTLPNVKIIYVLRDPINRLLSHVHHNLLKGDEREDHYIGKLRNPESHYINCSRYYMQLEKYFPFFPKEQILILTAEELRENTPDTMKKIFEFLNLNNADYHHSEYQKTRHISSGRRKILNPYLRRFLKNKPYYNFIASNLNFVIPTRVIPKPNPPDEVIGQLKSIFREDVKKLKSYTGRSFKEWHHDYD
jgi:hypothetical protein